MRPLSLCCFLRGVVLLVNTGIFEAEAGLLYWAPAGALVTVEDLKVAKEDGIFDGVLLFTDDFGVDFVTDFGIAVFSGVGLIFLGTLTFADDLGDGLRTDDLGVVFLTETFGVAFFTEDFAWALGVAFGDALRAGVDCAGLGVLEGDDFFPNEPRSDVLLAGEVDGVDLEV